MGFHLAPFGDWLAGQPRQPDFVIFAYYVRIIIETPVPFVIDFARHL